MLIMPKKAESHLQSFQKKMKDDAENEQLYVYKINLKRIGAKGDS